MHRLKAYRIDLLIILGFFVLPMLLLADVTIGSKTMLPADNLFQWEPWASAAPQFDAEIPQNGLLTDLIIENYVWKQYLIDTVKSGDIPLWNPNLFAGAPFLATGQHSAYYPFAIIFFLLPLAKAYGWFAVSQLWLAGLMMYIFGRVLKMRRSSAALAGLIYQGSGFLLVSTAVFPMVVSAAAWLPFLLACIHVITAQSKRKLLWSVAGSIALGVQIFAGHIEITYYTLLIMALYALWRLVISGWMMKSVKPLFQPAALLLGMVIVGLMLGAVQLIPFYEVGSVNFREGAAAFDEVLGWAFPKRRILTLAMPNFFGNPSTHEYVDVLDGGGVVPLTTNYYGNPNPHGATTSNWGIKNYVEGGIYLGILSLFLALLGIWGAGFKKKRNNQQSTNGVWFKTFMAHPASFFTGLSFFALAFIFGTPLYGILYYGLPFINQLHTPFRWVWPLSLAVAVLAGFGADYLARTRMWPDYAAWLTFKARWENDPEEMKRAVLATDSKMAGWKRPFTLYASPSPITYLAGVTFWGGLLLLIGLFASRFAYDAIAPAVEKLFLGMAQAPDAFPSARAFFSYEYRQAFFLGLMLMASGATLRVSRCPIFVRGKPIWLFMAAITITLDLFIANMGFHAAIAPELLKYEPALATWLQEQPDHWRLTSFAPNGDKPFNANSGWLYGLEDVRGYDSIIPKQYTEYMAAIEPQNELQFNRVQPIANWESLNSPLLDVLGVKYIITAETIDLPKLELAWEGDGLRVYENLAVAPRAYTLPKTAVIETKNGLAAMAEYDPRQYVIRQMGNGEWDAESGHLLMSSEAIPEPQTLIPATITDYSNRQVMVDVNGEEPSWLILNDSYFEGWKAFIRPYGAEESDEESLDVHLVNGNFRGVEVPAGAWSVRFRYSPASFQLGAFLSFLGGIIVLFTLGVWGWLMVYKPDAKMNTVRSLAKNSGVPMALNLFNKFIDFGFAAFYLRFLGPANAGSYAYAIATAGLFDIISNFGLNLLIIRDVSQDKSQASRYLLNTTVLRFGTGAMAALPIAIYLVAAGRTTNPPTADEVMAIALIMLGMVISGMAGGVTGLFYVYEKAEIPAALTTATTILKVSLGAMALLTGFGFVGLAGVSIVVNIFTLAALTLLAFRHFELPGPWEVDLSLQQKMVKKGYPLMLIHLLQTVFISIDVILLKTMLNNGEEVVGWYNSAYKWFNALQILPSFFTLALFPIISREIGRSMESARRMYEMSLKLMLLLALPIAAVTFAAAPVLVGIVAGAEFLPHGAIALQIVIWSIPIGWLNSVTNYVLISLGLERLQPRAFAIAVGFNIGANILFIPRFGYVAAGVTTILSEVVLFVLFAYYLRQRMAGVRWGWLLKRPFIAAILMLITIFFGGQIHLFVGLVLGTAVYVGSLFALRVIGDEEREILVQILPARLGEKLGW